MGNGELNHAQLEKKYAACPYSDQKSNKSTPRRETTRARPTQTPAGSGESRKVRHVQETARRKVDRGSSDLEDGSKPGLNRKFRLLSCKSHRFRARANIYLHVFILFVLCALCSSAYQPTRKNNTILLIFARRFLPWGMGS